MRKITAVLCLLMFVGTVGMVFAQDAPAEKKEEKKEQSALGTFAGVIFMEYKQDLADDHAAVFALNRIFLDFKKDFGDIFSARIITDAAPEVDGTDPDDEGYELFIYNAYLQAAPKFDMVNLTMQAGIIPTPVVSLMNNLSGTRWIGNTYIGDSKYILSDNTIDSAVDVGVNFSAEVAKMVTISGAIVKGEGSKKVKAETMVYGPSYYALVSINPLEKLYVNGFFRYKGEAGDTTMMYYGGGIAWKDGMIKTGLNYISVSYSNGTDESGYILDAWLNVNFETVLGMPVLALGKAGYGNYEDAAKGIFGFGPGYQFNKNVQTALYYEVTYSDAAKENHNIYVKVEVKI